MPMYKVYGRKYHDYYIKIDADSPDEAYDKAMQDHVQWFELETDDSIEPYEVSLDEDTSEDIQLNKDEWPEMESGILITGTN